MLYIFRLETSKRSEQLSETGRAFLWQELQQGRLRQGWGIDGMSLLDDRNEPIPRDQWVHNFKHAAERAGWKRKGRTDAAARRRHALLSQMRKIRSGDLLLVPNLTATDRRGLVLVRAVSRDGTLDTDCYDWDGGARRHTHPLKDDRRDFLRVDPFSIRAASHDHGSVAAKIRTLLKPLQSCVVPVNEKQNDELARNVRRLYGGPLSVPNGRNQKKKNQGPKKGHPPTAGQLKRGLDGEEEVLRRLKLRSGIFGLKYLDDRRNSSDGFDFLCTDGEQDFEVEVKTFSATDGQIIISENELRRAASTKEHYCLLGVFDNGRRASDWEVRALRSPWAELNRVGIEQIVRHIRANPNLIRWHPQAPALEVEVGGRPPHRLNLVPIRGPSRGRGPGGQ